MFGKIALPNRKKTMNSYNTPIFFIFLSLASPSYPPARSISRTPDHVEAQPSAPTFPRGWSPHVRPSSWRRSRLRPPSPLVMPSIPVAFPPIVASLLTYGHMLPPSARDPITASLTTPKIQPSPPSPRQPPVPELQPRPPFSQAPRAP